MEKAYNLSRDAEYINMETTTVILDDFIAVHDKKNETDETRRLVGVFAGQMMYESTGDNSREENTWFPFAGFQETKSVHAPKGKFLKPSTAIDDDLEEFYPPDISQYLIKNYAITQNLITRFGNFNGMCLSYIIGGGYWEKPESKALAKLLTDNYGAYLRLLEQDCDKQLSNLKALKRGEAKVSVYGVEPVELNQWLINHGANIQRDNYNNIITDFTLYPKHADLSDRIDTHITKVKNDLKYFSFYRPEAKQDKLKVLQAAKLYLERKIDKADFEKILKESSFYANALGGSKTRKLIDEVIMEKAQEKTDVLVKMTEKMS